MRVHKFSTQPQRRAYNFGVISPSVIEIQPHRCGWVCAQANGPGRVFTLRTQAIQFAERECDAVEIRVRNRHGAMERRLVRNPEQHALSA